MATNRGAKWLTGGGTEAPVGGRVTSMLGLVSISKSSVAVVPTPIALGEAEPGVAAREIDMFVAHDKRNAQSGMFGMEAVEKRRLHDAVDNRLWAGDAAGAGVQGPYRRKDTIRRLC